MMIVQTGLPWCLPEAPRAALPRGNTVKLWPSRPLLAFWSVGRHSRDRLQRPTPRSLPAASLRTLVLLAGLSRPPPWKGSRWSRAFIPSRAPRPRPPPAPPFRLRPILTPHLWSGWLACSPVRSLLSLKTDGTGGGSRDPRQV